VFVWSKRQKSLGETTVLTGIILSAGILLILILFYVTDTLIITRFDHARTADGSGRSWDYTFMALAMGTAIVIQPVVLPQIGLTIDTWWALIIQLLGWLLSFSGLILHWWSRAALREFYAERVELQPEHRLIDSGPYAYVRHPAFTSFFMIVTGFFVWNPALTTLLVMIYTFWDFSRAARQEENLLSGNVPGYREYMSHTSAFVPPLSRLWGHKTNKTA